MSAEIEEKKSVHPEYAELLCDFMFKRLFGSEANKDVLMGFLNMILEDVQIKDVKFIPTEHFGLTKKDRKAIFDISCECADGRTLIIEVQKGYQEHFRKRAVFYTCFPINEQGRLAKEEYIREHQCKDDGEEFRRLFILAKIGKFTPEEMKEYEKSLKNMNDYYNIIDSAEKRARDEGRLEGELRGLEKGRGEAKREDAMKLRELGVDLKIISQATGLPVEEIEAL